jgi:hypothetical protein
MLFNPRTESTVMLILAPAIAVLAARPGGESRGLVLAALALALGTPA